MNSEKNTLKLIDMLDKAVDEIEKIDKRLREYEEKISAVGDAVRIVGERDNVIQLQQTNQNALLGLLNNMISSLEFSVENKRLLVRAQGRGKRATLRGRGQSALGHTREGDSHRLAQDEGLRGSDQVLGELEAQVLRHGYSSFEERHRLFGNYNSN